MATRNTAGLSTSPGTLNAPAGYGGENAPVMGGKGEAEDQIKVLKAANSQMGTKVAASTEAKTVLNLSAAIVIGGVVLLWVLGGIVFKNANL